MNALSVVEIFLGITLIAIALTDAFETIVLPRTVSRPFRLTNLVFALNRWCYERVGDLKEGPLRQRLLVSAAPLSLFVLICFWGVILILGFTCIGDGLHVPFRAVGTTTFLNRFYFCAMTFFTFGFGDFVPISPPGKIMALIEAGTGFMFLALIIGYVPVFYSSFSQREKTILLLDSKAGSDPTACEILRRHAEADCLDELPVLLKDWEVLSAQLLENFLSYPILALYRSQHDDQSWLNSLTSVMDACALCLAFFPDESPYAKKTKFQAKATFTMARHLVVDVAYVLKIEPQKPLERLNHVKFQAMTDVIAKDGLKLCLDEESHKKFKETLSLYDPFVTGLSKHLKMTLPEWVPSRHLPDNWETSAWDGTHF